MRIVKRVAIGIMIVVFVIGVGAAVAWKLLLGQINRPTETTTIIGAVTVATFESTAPLTHPIPDVKGVTNLLLLGVDNRDLEDTDTLGLSDVTIVVTIDANNKVIKLTSFQRDMLVYMQGSDIPVKLTQVHGIGGTEATLRTLNENFRLDLEDYVEVDMNEAERLIDIVGGVEIDISPEIIWEANQCINMQNLFFPETEPVVFIDTAGVQRLNGRQAVGYARVRHIDSDYKRMGRQREVLQAIFLSFLDADIVSKGRMVGAGFSLITTSLSDSEITRLALQVAPAMSHDTLQKQVPDPARYRVDFYESDDDNIRVDINSVISDLHTFLYNESRPFDPVREIPGAPNAAEPLPSGVEYRE